MSSRELTLSPQKRRQRSLHQSSHHRKKTSTHYYYDAPPEVQTVQCPSVVDVVTNVTKFITLSYDVPDAVPDYDFDDADMKNGGGGGGNFNPHRNQRTSSAVCIYDENDDDNEGAPAGFPGAYGRAGGGGGSGGGGARLRTKSWAMLATSPSEKKYGAGGGGSRNDEYDDVDLDPPPPPKNEDPYQRKIREIQDEHHRQKTQERLAAAVFGYPMSLRDLYEQAQETQKMRARKERMIDELVDILAERLKQVVLRRQLRTARGEHEEEEDPMNAHQLMSCGTVIDEVTETVTLPEFNPEDFLEYIDPDTIDLDDDVFFQLKNYVTIVASMYRNNPFHNFEHAVHVTKSADKLLQRVVAPGLLIRRYISLHKCGSGLQKQIASDLHNYTYGIASDPLTQLAIVFSALIHDVDHSGVSNMQLVKEDSPVAKKYKGKSVAEQNSIDIAWDILMDPKEFGALHKLIFPTTSEFKRFRQVVVNIVIATDIFDPALGAARKEMWAKVFDPERAAEIDPEELKSLKTGIVIEHIMQAADVSHTMQDWENYQKFNHRLFDELYSAFKAGRMGVDPASFWYEGEIKFFDGYIIPLAKKLKDCGVFGLASDECLTYATANRDRWREEGAGVLKMLLENYAIREKEEAEAAQSASKDGAGGAGAAGMGGMKSGVRRQLSKKAE